MATQKKSTPKKRTKRQPRPSTPHEVFPPLPTYSPSIVRKKFPIVSWHEFIATGFFSGYLPKAPGTWGSLCAVFLFYFIAQFLPAQGSVSIGFLSLSWFALFLGTLATFIGIYTSQKLADEWNEKDPGEIVIDEFAGIFFACLLIPATPLALLLAFLFIRVFDILKPGPIASLQNLPGGRGIVLDDVLAGLFAAPLAFIFHWVFTKWIF
ncbi:MAG TPA: phosphatidylglycerophosphatase A [Turneriella sp.]|nr:phosphatidylglycerophosphatase A [Turneriella sp.]